MIKKRLFIPIVFSIMAFKCGGDSLKLTNNTNNDIIVLNYLWNPDSTLYNVSKYEVDHNFPTMIRNSVSKEMYVQNSFQESDTIVLVVYNKTSVNKALKNKLEKYDVNQMIYVSKNYVERHNWKIKIDSIKKTKRIKL